MVSKGQFVGLDWNRITRDAVPDRFTDMVIIVVRPPWVRCEFLAELPLVLIL